MAYVGEFQTDIIGAWKLQEFKGEARLRSLVKVGNHLMKENIASNPNLMLMLQNPISQYILDNIPWCFIVILYEKYHY